jgi:hypothetical protein
MNDYRYPPQPVDPAEIARIIRANPERHYQSTWVITSARETLVEEMRPYARKPYPDRPVNPYHPVCMTRACVGGWTAILAAPDGSSLSAYGYLVFPDSSRVPVSMYARDALGITCDAATLLFDGYNTREQVLAALDRLADDRLADISGIFGS